MTGVLQAVLAFQNILKITIQQIQEKVQPIKINGGLSPQMRHLQYWFRELHNLKNHMQQILQTQVHRLHLIARKMIAMTLFLLKSNMSMIQRTKNS